MGNPLGTRGGRLLTFFLLYVTEGIPLGFTATAIATQMRRQGLGPDAIGAFVASLYLPWGWKWVVGPFVDTLYSDRLGRRRAWIVGCQAAMVLTLLAAIPVDFVTKLRWFAWVIAVHNAFAATMDVAIDSLAVSVLKADERGLANGMMFAGAYVGNGVGGAGVLFLTPYVPFNLTFVAVAAGIACVTLFVSLRIREPRRALDLDEPPPDKSLVDHAFAQIREYVRTAARAMFGRRSSVAGLAFALLPAGAHSLGLAVQSSLAVELGLTDAKIATLSLASTILAAAGCVAGGALSDRFGRRRMIAAYIVATAGPVLAMAAATQAYGWVMPAAPGAAAGRPAPAGALVGVFWAASLVFSFVQGLMYGTRTALFMDVCSPKVAATQFTAYMAMLNLTIAYSAWWQGRAAARVGYPLTFLVDAGFGLVCLMLLPFMSKWVEEKRPPDRGFEPILVPSGPAAVGGGPSDEAPPGAAGTPAA